VKKGKGWERAGKRRFTRGEIIQQIEISLKRSVDVSTSARVC